MEISVLYCVVGNHLYVHLFTCFNLADRHPPKLVNCPADIYAVAGEKISWAIPKATDNVGIRDLWLVPNVHNGSQIGSGNHVFRYVAEDWHGNKAECRFIVSVLGSGTYVFVLYFKLASDIIMMISLNAIEEL